MKNKMHLKFVFIFVFATFLEVKSDCKNFLQCLKHVLDYLVEFDSEQTKNYTLSIVHNKSTDYIELTSDISEDIQKIASDLSNILEVSGGLKSNKSDLIVTNNNTKLFLTDLSNTTLRLIMNKGGQTFFSPSKPINNTAKATHKNKPKNTTKMISKSETKNLTSAIQELTYNHENEGSDVLKIKQKTGIILQNETNIANIALRTKMSTSKQMKITNNNIETTNNGNVSVANVNGNNRLVLPKNVTRENIINKNMKNTDRKLMNKTHINDHIERKEHKLKTNLFTVKNNETYVRDLITTSSYYNINQATENSVKVLKENEISVGDSYNYDEDNSTDYPIIDYLELYKDTTNEDVYVTFVPQDLLGKMKNREKEIDTNIDHLMETIISNDHMQEEEAEKLNEIQKVVRAGKQQDDDKFVTSCDGNNHKSVEEAVFPWIVAIFVRNSDVVNQFDYYCDGALLSNRTVLTAARCVLKNGTEQKTDLADMVVVAGKRSLQLMNTEEKLLKILDINIHDNFTADGEFEHDLAIIKLEDEVIFTNAIQPACLSDYNEEITQAATTGWKFTGELAPIYFTTTTGGICQDIATESKFCATYGNDVTVCPSYGGLYMVRNKTPSWRLRGIFSGDPGKRDVCTNNTVIYTNLEHYVEWIANTYVNNK